MSYDVYYATGGGSLVYGGSDVWVNNWLREIASKLDYPSKLLLIVILPQVITQRVQQLIMVLLIKLLGLDVLIIVDNFY
ncbi:hypothetical protein CMI38_06340 [Candidatus Pacearchaeota archaeon]|jgi:hypothetical protein|nr:hypothetical protein [Candidatus Pacearchaeota archaeon]|tara:strand:+ start:257 stop:493 length:237 start_codon:yes stop_codon:yes gene_type:complete